MIQPPTKEKCNEYEAEKPLYRVTFSRVTGKDKDGNDVLAYPREIGAVWPRKDEKKEAVLNLDLITTDLVNRNGVVPGPARRDLEAR